MTTILFRCDGATLPEIGTGHVIRDLTIARAMINEGLCAANDVMFATRREAAYRVGADMVRDAGHSFLACSDEDLNPMGQNEGQTLAGSGAQLIVFDRLATTKATIVSAQSKGARVVTFDDEGDGVGASDLTINAILNANTTSSNLVAGYRYLILPEGTPRWRERQGEVKRIFASFGGYDRQNYCSALIEAAPYFDTDARIDIAIGAVEGETLKTLKEKIPIGIRRKLYIHERPNNYAEILDAADLAIVASGLSVFQCVAAGVPTIGVAQYSHQRETLRKLEKLGGICNGDSWGNDPESFSKGVNAVLASDEQRNHFSKAGALIVDHNGQDRVIRKLASLLDGKT